MFFLVAINVKWFKPINRLDYFYLLHDLNYKLTLSLMVNAMKYVLCSFTRKPTTLVTLPKTPRY